MNVCGLVWENEISRNLDASMIMHDTLDIVHTKEAEVVTIEEGETVFNRTYVKSVSTEIIMDRTFTIPGYIYNLTLVSFNMHDITAPNIIMRWHVECANPVVAADWSLDYEPNIRYGEVFNITLRVRAGAALPTRPRLHVYAVKEVSTDI